MGIFTLLLFIGFFLLAFNGQKHFFGTQIKDAGFCCKEFNEYSFLGMESLLQFNHINQRKSEKN
jgi:hypothetical protein